MPGSTLFRPIHPVYRNLCVLTEGTADVYRNKTAMGLLRFRGEDVVAVLDTAHVGKSLKDATGIDRDIPVVGSIIDAKRLGAEWLVIGVATPGGFLPSSLRPHVYEAIRNRIGVISGLHESVNGDPNLVALAARYCVELVNLRATPDDRLIATALARHTKAFRLMLVGTDANIGKTTVALELNRHFNQLRPRIRSRIVSTGQDAILITGRGVAIDRMISDFAAGMVEQLVLAEDKAGADLLVIEGQNGILSPPYSGTALSVLHGACPDALILCANPTRANLRHTDVPMPSLTTFIHLYEAMAAPVHPAKVVAVCLNTQELGAAEAAAALIEATRETGLPAVDVSRDTARSLAVLTTAVQGARKTAVRRSAPPVTRKSPARRKRAAR